MQPLLLNPALKRARWGGRRLESLFQKGLGPESDYAESWEVVDRGAVQSAVASGAAAGRTLRSVMEEQRGALLGRHAGYEQFPLLIKLLDATDRLSVQVHPNCRQAAAMQLGESGKSEAWVILEASAESRLWVGLRPEVTAESLRRALAAGEIEACLHAFRPRRGDCIDVPAGTVHAIGEGIVLAEVQQPSDLTFRLSDWGRVDTDGSPRTLHIEQALECIDFERGPVNPVRPVRIEEAAHYCERLIASPHFVMVRHISAAAFEIVDDPRFHVLMMLEGAAELRAGNETLALPRGATALLPAERPECTLHPQGEASILDVFLPLEGVGG